MARHTRDRPRCSQVSRATWSASYGRSRTACDSTFHSSLVVSASDGLSGQLPPSPRTAWFLHRRLPSRPRPDRPLAPQAAGPPPASHPHVREPHALGFLRRRLVEKEEAASSTPTDEATRAQGGLVRSSESVSELRRGSCLAARGSVCAWSQPVCPGMCACARDRESRRAPAKGWLRCSSRKSCERRESNKKRGPGACGPGRASARGAGGDSSRAQTSRVESPSRADRGPRGLRIFIYSRRAGVPPITSATMYKGKAAPHIRD